MNSFILMLALLSALALCAAAVSLFALHRAHLILREADRRPPALPPAASEELRDLRDAVEALAGQIHEFDKHPRATLEPAAPRPGLNLSKRSQALRLDRRGESPDQIATALDLPRQEVELLLKVHRIVLSNV